MKKNQLQRLVDIKFDLEELVNEADELIRKSGNKFAYNRANAYWLGEFKSGFTKNSMHTCTFDETIETLESDEEE